MTRAEAVRWQEHLFPRTNSPAMTLPEICLDVRASVNGSADPWQTETLQPVVSMLQARLDTWLEPSSAMDEHVRGMVAQAVVLGLAELARRAEEEGGVSGAQELPVVVVSASSGGRRAGTAHGDCQDCRPVG